MKSAITLAAVAGLASVAAAQTGSLSIVASAGTVDTTGASATVTLAVYGDADFGTAIAGGAFGLSATGGAGVVTGMTGAAAAWGALGEQDNGHAGDGNYNGLIFGQLIFPPFINPDPGSLLGNGPVLLGTVTVTFAANSSGVVDWTTTSAGDFVMEIFEDNGADGVFTQLTAVAAGSASVNVVPAPSAMALLGLGGLVAGRRRR